MADKKIQFESLDDLMDEGQKITEEGSGAAPDPSLYIPDRKAQRQNAGSDRRAESQDRRSEANDRRAEVPDRKQGGGAKILLPVLLVLALLIAGIRIYRSQVAKAAAEAESASVEASIQASLEESRALEAMKPKAVPVSKSDIPELSILVREYFDARMQADSTRIFEIFGRKDTTADPEFEKKLKAQASWIQNYLNIEIYDAPGTENGERFCLVRYDVDFRRTDTLAPGVMYFYARQLPEGGFVLQETLMKDKMDYVLAELEDPSVTALVEDTNARLKEALDADSTLALIYTSFRNGEIYKESDLEVNKEQEVDLFMDPEDSILIDRELYDSLYQEESQTPETTSNE